jgi:hypothetical protein
MNRNYSHKPPKQGTNDNRGPYDKMSPGLIFFLMLFPIPVIFIVLAGNYSPRNKLCWALAAALEMAVTVVLTLMTLHSFIDAFSVL